MAEQYAPILMILIANSIYHISSKSVSKDANSMAALAFTYVLAAVGAALLYFLSSKGCSLVGEWRKLNWASITLAVGMSGMELGYLWAYRQGGKINLTSLTANICVAVFLLLIGRFFFKETVSLRQLAGMLISVIGLCVMNY